MRGIVSDSMSSPPLAGPAHTGALPADPQVVTADPGRPTSGGRKVTWDLLRCACVTMVMLYHSTFIGPTVYTQFRPRSLVFAHQIGASLLLTISAYFIAVTLRRPRITTTAWWRGKLARLLPSFVVATVAAWASLHYLAPPGLYYPDLPRSGRTSRCCGTGTVSGPGTTSTARTGRSRCS